MGAPWTGMLLTLSAAALLWSGCVPTDSAGGGDGAPLYGDATPSDEGVAADEGAERDAAPQADEGVEADVAPQADEGVELDADPQADEGVELDADPQADEGVEADAAPQADEGVEADAAPQADEGVEADAAPQADEGVEADAAPQADEGVEADAAPQADEGVEADAACEGDDSDEDGVPDSCDVCEGEDDTLDEDRDGVPDGCDVCEGDDHVDADGDGVICAEDCDDEVPTVWPEAPELCDGLDNDCDEAIDEDLTPPIRGEMGVCEGAEAICGGEAGWLAPDYARIAGYEVEEASCDGLDNDCDGEVDELDPQPAELSVGVCEGLTRICFNGAWLEPNLGQVAGYEAEERSCDGLDNDCDGLVDEGLVPPDAALQAGVCAGAAQICANGAWAEPDYAQLQGYEVSEGTCDGLDNDCDGEIDEALTGPDAALQAGVCAGAAQACVNGAWVEPDYAQVQGYEADEATCDGLDNDCDGAIDEALSGPDAALQAGVCFGAAQVCADGAWGEPDYAQIQGYELVEATCDGLDNDCDGAVDEDLPAPPASLDVGVCAGAAQICVNDAWIEPDYTQIPGYEVDEVTCDDRDNDCDGEIDEGMNLGAACEGVGACGAGTIVCSVDGVARCSTDPDAPDSQAVDEICDDMDNDCDGEVDEGLDCPDPGELDPTFGEGGVARLDLGGPADARAVHVDAEGRAWIAGRVRLADDDLLLARLDATGALDVSFDDDGFQAIDLGDHDRAYALAARPEGGFLLAGYATIAARIQQVILALDRDGARVEAFADQGVYLGSEGVLTALRTTPEAVFAAGHRILNGGVLGAWLTRLGPDGQLDVWQSASEVQMPGVDLHVQALSLTPDGQIHLGGYMERDDDDDAHLLSFDARGVMTESAALDADETATLERFMASAPRADGGFFGVGLHTGQPAVARFDEAGQLDLLFGSLGFARLDFGAPAVPLAVVVGADADGRELIYVAGYAERPQRRAAVIARLNRDGQLDATFGVEGLVELPLAEDTTLTGVALDPSHRALIAVGYTGAPASRSVIAARLHL